MGIIVNVYRREGEDCTINGESATKKGFTITDIRGPFEPCEDYPAAKLIKQKFGFGCSLYLMPESKSDKDAMFGGNFAYTSDSRFGEKCRELMGEDLGNFYGLGPVPIFDRVE